MTVPRLSTHPVYRTEDASKIFLILENTEVKGGIKR